MKILLTGGCGDLGTVLTYRLEKHGDVAIRFDVREPADKRGQFIQGSILDRQKLATVMPGVDCIIHIAAWHDHHEQTTQKTIYDFWDLNVTGTFNVFQAAKSANIKKIIFISSDAVDNKTGAYGWSKMIGEDIAQRYIDEHLFSVLTLRPRSFIPYWNQSVYPSYVDWAKSFLKGAVHINDVAQAVMQGLDLISQKSLYEHLVLPIDGAYEYTNSDLQSWDKAGPGSTFKKTYEKYHALAVRHGLDIATKPTLQDISDTKDWLGYNPSYSLKNALEDLLQHGERGPQVSFD